MQKEEAKKRELKKKLDEQCDTKQQIKEFVQLAKEQNAFNDEQIAELLLSKNMKKDSTYLDEIKRYMENLNAIHERDAALMDKHDLKVTQAQN